ncbi:MAG: DUF368 domain-containing protein [Clostridia bacterium]|nr:DUF368 domain-containing protein [Clostridia bacterium]
MVMEILRGAVIGLANIIPGVSGGTMMVSMGIYDTLIHCITHLFKEFKKSVLTLLPYAIGMVAAIVGLSFVIAFLFDHYPLPTNTAFIGLILGGLPVIFKRVKDSPRKPGSVGGVLFLLFFALIIALQIMGESGGHAVTITLSLVEIVKLLCIGMLASATMVIPGVSGSMILMLLGYYDPVISSISGLVTALTAGDWGLVFHNAGILIPFGLGIVIGIFAIAKLIEVLMAKWESWTYCAILGLVCASPVAILMSTSFAGLSVGLVVVSLITFAVGFYAAYLMGKHQEV